MVVTTVALVLVLAACLDRQSLCAAAAVPGHGWTALAAHRRDWAASRAAFGATARFGTAGRALLLALPFAALCFVLVPRLSGRVVVHAAANRRRPASPTR